jgi:threonine dehydrogenase-like Zn-dependent dehydrogenase
MQAARASYGAVELSMETVSVPLVGKYDALIKVAAAGLAPGPFTFLQSGLMSELPRTIGHQVSGTISQVGDAVGHLSIGQRVRLNPNLACGSCKYCSGSRGNVCTEASSIGFARFSAAETSSWSRYKDGGLAEYMLAPVEMFELLPNHVSFEVGAKLYELANAHCVLRVAELKPASTICILAPTGGLGTCCVRLASFFDVKRIIAVERSKARIIEVGKLTEIIYESIGLDEFAPDWQSTKQLSKTLSQLVPDGLDAIFDFTRSGAALYEIVGLLNPYGTFVHMGGNPTVLPLPLAAVMGKCLRIVGSKIHTQTDIQTVAGWLDTGALLADDLISHIPPFDRLSEAVELVTQRRVAVWNVVVRIDEK